MNVVPFDILLMARRRKREEELERRRDEDAATLADTIFSELLTRRDLDAVRRDIRADLRQLERRLTINIAAMLALAVAALAAL